MTLTTYLDGENSSVNNSQKLLDDLLRPLEAIAKALLKPSQKDSRSSLLTGPREAIAKRMLRAGSEHLEKVAKNVMWLVRQRSQILSGNGSGRTVPRNQNQKSCLFQLRLASIMTRRQRFLVTYKFKRRTKAVLNGKQIPNVGG